MTADDVSKMADVARQFLSNSQRDQAAARRKPADEQTPQPLGDPRPEQRCGSADCVKNSSLERPERIVWLMAAGTVTPGRACALYGRYAAGQGQSVMAVRWDDHEVHLQGFALAGTRQGDDMLADAELESLLADMPHGGQTAADTVDGALRRAQCVAICPTDMLDEAMENFAGLIDEVVIAADNDRDGLTGSYTLLKRYLYQADTAVPVTLLADARSGDPDGTLDVARRVQQVAANFLETDIEAVTVDAADTPRAEPLYIGNDIQAVTSHLAQSLQTAKRRAMTGADKTADDAVRCDVPVCRPVRVDALPDNDAALTAMLCDPAVLESALELRAPLLVPMEKDDMPFAVAIDARGDLHVLVMTLQDDPAVAARAMEAWQRLCDRRDALWGRYKQLLCNVEHTPSIVVATASEGKRLRQELDRKAACAVTMRRVWLFGDDAGCGLLVTPMA